MSAGHDDRTFFCATPMPKAEAYENPRLARLSVPPERRCLSIARKTVPVSLTDHLGRVYRCNPTSAAASRPITHDQSCTGLHSNASWEQIGNRIGNVNPMRPQCENTKEATCEPWIRRLQAPPQRVSNTTSMAEVPDSKSGPRKRVWVQVAPSVIEWPVVGGVELRGRSKRPDRPPTITLMGGASSTIFRFEDAQSRACRSFPLRGILMP
jgi:hypothetical protein